MSRNSRYIDTVDAAKLLRTMLRGKFPGVKFSVKSSRYAGGSSVHISWDDGPTEKSVRALTQPYAGAGFDGMIDMQYYKTAILLKDGTVTYGKSDGTVASRGSDPGYRNELPEGAEYVRFGCDYVQTSRGYSNDAVYASVDIFNREELYEGEPPITLEETKWGLRVGCAEPGYNGPLGRFQKWIAEKDYIKV